MNAEFTNKLKELSVNELGELAQLLSRIKSNIIDFSHVSDFLPSLLTNSIDETIQYVNQEIEDRDLYFNKTKGGNKL